jgi:hypothetical protein
MKRLTVATMALIGASFLASPGSAMPMNAGVGAYTPESAVIQVGSKWDGKYGSWNGKRKYWRHRRHRHHHHDHDNFAFGFGIPLFLGAIALANRDRDDVDCIGRWHRHSSGRFHCHGDLVYD